VNKNSSWPSESLGKRPHGNSEFVEVSEKTYLKRTSQLEFTAHEI
jgi:hypothetical protein